LTGGGLIRSAGGWSAVKAAYRDGIRLASDERLLGSSEFVESTLKEAGETYNRRMQLQSAGLGLSQVIEAVCQYFGIDEMDLTCLTKRSAVTQARGLIGHIATRELSIPGSVVARRFNQGRSAVSRAAQQVSQNAELLRIARRILKRFGLKYINIETTSLLY
jgi:chromosomal replication initiation ATPase DnaA